MSDEMVLADEQVTDVSFSLAHTDALESMKRAGEVVKYMADKCTGPKFIAQISQRLYPKVEWWTTVGSALGVFPQEESSTRLERDELTYEAVVKVCHGEQVISRASAICSASEKSWRNRDEYAIKSMATTRATGKAYRIAFSFLAVLAGLEATPAEEIPREPKTDNSTDNPPDDEADKQQILYDDIADVMQQTLDGAPIFSPEERMGVSAAVKKAKTLKDLSAIRNAQAIKRDQRLPSKPATEESEKNDKQMGIF